MSIKDFKEKIKLFYGEIGEKVYNKEDGLKIKSDLFIIILIILTSFASFGLGRLSALEKQKTPISIIKNTSNELVPNNASSTSSGVVFGSKTGTKYYYPWCSGADRIKEENRVWFYSLDDAKSAGLTEATGCNKQK